MKKNMVRICALFCLSISGMIRSAGSELTLFDRITQLEDATNNMAQIESRGRSSSDSLSDHRKYQSLKSFVQQYPTELFFAQKLALLDQPGVGVFNELPGYENFTAEIILRERNDWGKFANPFQDILSLLPEHINMESLTIIVAEFVSLVTDENHDRLCIEIAKLSKSIASHLENIQSLDYPLPIEEVVVETIQNRNSRSPYNDDYLSEEEEEENKYDFINSFEQKTKKSFFALLKNWLYHFGEPTIAYACSIVFPYLLQSIHNISNENTTVNMTVGLASIYILREKMLEKKIHKTMITCAMVAGIIAYAVHTKQQI